MFLQLGKALGRRRYKQDREAHHTNKETKWIQSSAFSYVSNLIDGNFRNQYSFSSARRLEGGGWRPTKGGLLGHSRPPRLNYWLVTSGYPDDPEVEGGIEYDLEGYLEDELEKDLEDNLDEDLEDNLEDVRDAFIYVLAEFVR